MSRIIAGSARGHRLTMPDHRRTRPTTDRVREAVFSALVSWVDGQDRPPAAALESFSFLDLYAGSGAIGLEAASRGAGPVTLVEADRATCDVIRANARTLSIEVDVRQAKVESLIAGPAPRAYDIIWADPPYEIDSARLDEIIATAVAGGWLARYGLVVLERSRRTPAPVWPDELPERWQRDYGETIVHFAAHDDAQEEA